METLSLGEVLMGLNMVFDWAQSIDMDDAVGDDRINQAKHVNANESVFALAA